MPDHELSLSRLINAPRAAVWQAWADPRIFEQWWIPAPITCRVDMMDLWPGGGFVPHVDGCFLDVVPGARVVFTTLLRANWVPADPWLALTAIITPDDDAGGTRYVARALHKTAADCRKHADMGFDEGWGAAIDQLAAVAQAQRPPDNL